MKLKLVVAFVALVAAPLYAGAQAQKPPAAPKAVKITNADAQKVVKLISADKAKTQKYCELAKLGDDMEQAEKNKDNKIWDELQQKADDLVNQIGPEYASLMDGLADMNPESKEGQAIGQTLEGLDKLCAK